MKGLAVVKLGGSIITNKKSGSPALRSHRVHDIARQLVRVRAEHPGLRIILLHGAGSFGHPLAHRYKLTDQLLSKKALVGVGYTTSAVRELGNLLSKTFLNAGVPAVPLQTSSFTCMKRGRPHFYDLTVLKTILKNGGVPLLGGDIVFSEFGKTAIASADGLAVALVKKFKGAQLYFATDVDGVYATFPPRRREDPMKSLSRVQLIHLLGTMRPKTTHSDVTGAMLGKLRALLDIRSTAAAIFNGNAPRALEDALSGKRRGTQIVL